jgi:hypothetical protein
VDSTISRYQPSNRRFLGDIETQALRLFRPG